MDALSHPDPADLRLPLPGDNHLGDSRVQITHEISINATPAEIWPHLLNMVCRAAASAWSSPVDVRVSVLLSDRPRALVLGALYDHAARRYVPFDGPRPAHFWQATWALVLDLVSDFRTVLRARARVAYTFDAVQWSAVWLHPFNSFIDNEELRRLKARVEGGPPSPASYRTAS